VSVNPDGEPGWDGPLDVQIPNDARALERDVLAYHREVRALRRRRRLRRFLPSQAGIMPLLASILAVCLVAGMMLSVFTISPAGERGKPHTHTPQPGQSSSSTQPASQPASQAAGTHPASQPAASHPASQPAPSHPAMQPARFR
jgi:hypothetical protein